MKVSDTATYLETEALEGKDVTVTIESVRPTSPKDIGKDGKKMSEKSVIISYKGAKKEHVACRTVQKQIRNLYGNDTSNWIGKKITLFPDTCNAFGNPKTPCIRVRNINPETGKAPEAF
jgi:hypothetical protein